MPIGISKNISTISAGVLTYPYIILSSVIVYMLLISIPIFLAASRLYYKHQYFFFSILISVINELLFSDTLKSSFQIIKSKILTTLIF